MKLTPVLFSILAIASISTAKERESGANLNLFASPKPDKAKATQPPIVQLLEPRSFSHVEGKAVDLRWQALTGITSYHLQIATDPNFKWLVENDFTYPKTEYHLEHLEPGKHYYWRVAARKLDNDATYTKGFFVTSMFETADAAATSADSAH